jgi:ketosteroid isomerase-like protein
MHPNQKLLEDFYAAFNRKDGPAMVAAYADDVHFSDPVFPDLKGAEAKGMWKMLCGSAKDLTVEASRISADDTQGRAHWEAHYTFSVTGRKVHNIIDATFRFKDGRIVDHVDSFDFWRWSRLALGLPGVLLGWSPVVRNKVRGTARASLEKYLAGQKG